MSFWNKSHHQGHKQQQKARHFSELALTTVTNDLLISKSNRNFSFCRSCLPHLTPLITCALVLIFRLWLFLCLALPPVTRRWNYSGFCVLSSSRSCSGSSMTSWSRPYLFLQLRPLCTPRCLTNDGASAWILSHTHPPLFIDLFKPET